MKLSLSIPLVAPSVNAYVRHTRAGRHYVTAEATAFKAAVAVFARGRRVDADRYRVVISVYLGAKQKGDLDNFCKVILDSLVDARVITTDAAVYDLRLTKGRDRANPRTEIEIEGMDGGKNG